MKRTILSNKLKLIYKHSESDLTSICISVNGGACEEKGKLGVAHAVEHMVYKGTKKRSEKEINEELSNIFGFQNAMTNFPYVIFYGTLLKEDFKSGVELLSDIVLNPTFTEDGFKEEMDVIKEELKEWDEEAEQFCEDKLFLNSFDQRRIKYPIIGTTESLENISLKDLKEFYDDNYFPGNAAITVVSSLDYEEVLNVVDKYFSEWESKHDTDIDDKNNDYIYELPKNKIFYADRADMKTSKVEFICPIDKLSENELKALRIFNEFFGEGVNSLLFDTLRTKNGLVYDVLTNIAHEKYLKFYKITFSTSKDKVDTALELIDKCINELNTIKESLDEKNIKQYVKNLKLKKLFREEKSIILAKELATYETMFNNCAIYEDLADEIDDLKRDYVFEVGKKVLQKLSVQIVGR